MRVDLDLYEEFHKYARMVANEFYSGASSAIDREDCHSTAIVALYEAAESFEGDPYGEDRSAFLTQVRHAVSHAVNEEVAKVGFPVSGGRNSLERSNDDWPSGVPLHTGHTSAMQTEPLGDEDKLSLDAIYESLDVLTDRQREVIGLYYLDGLLSDTLVAERLGIARPNASKTRSKAEKVLREALVGYA